MNTKQFVRKNLKIYWLIIVLYSTVIFTMVACLPISQPPSSETAVITETAVLAKRLQAAVIASPTSTATVISPSPTMNTTPPPLPTATGSILEETVSVTHAALNTPSATLTLSPTATAVPQVQPIYSAVNLRRGPRFDYPIIGFIYAGEVVEVIAIHDGEDGWFNVVLGDGTLGWVGATVVEPVNDFNLSQIPTPATLPATSTATPTNTPTATNTPTPKPPKPQPHPTKVGPPATSVPPTATENPYP